MKRMLWMVFVAVTHVCNAYGPVQGSHLRWTTEFITENTPMGMRRVGLVRVFYDGQQIGLLDPRCLPVTVEGWVDECPDDDPNCYPPGVTTPAHVLAISPDEQRMVFFVNLVPDENSKFMMYFDVGSKKIVPLGKINGGELTDYTFGPDPDYAFVNDDFYFIVMNFKLNTVREIPPAGDALGDANVPPDVVIISGGVWLKPNILSFDFYQELCQNPDAEIGDRVFVALPGKTCTYNFETGEMKIQNLNSSSTVTQKEKTTAGPQVPRASEASKAIRGLAPEGKGR